MDYASHHLSGDLEEGKPVEIIENLLETDSDVKRRIKELIQLKDATEQALEVLSNPNLFHNVK